MVKIKDKLFLSIAWLLSLLLFFYAVDNIWGNYLLLQDMTRIFGITQSAISLFVFRSYFFIFLLSVPILALLLYNKQKRFHLSFKIFSVIVLLNAINQLYIYATLVWARPYELPLVIFMISEQAIAYPLIFVISAWFYIINIDPLSKIYGVPRILTWILVILGVLSIFSMFSMVNY